MQKTDATGANMTSIVIYTDLDGTLLDHHNYSHAAADDLLRELEIRGIPVVPVSSKTRAELLPLRRELDNRHPFIVENGAAVFIPRGYFTAQPADTQEQDGYWVKHFVLPRSHWLAKITELGEAFEGEFANFARMRVNTLAALTGLSHAEARRASQREFGEAVQWTGTPARRDAFIAALENAQARVLQGGRFLHVSGACDKGLALDWLNQHYAWQNDAKRPLSIATGDSQNDAAMLEAADVALLIRSPAHEPPIVARGDVILSQAFGPAGWNQGLREILSSLDSRKDASYG
jgi:mannosyl-3-phosphoglycerate phosphatase family protein